MLSYSASTPTNPKAFFDILIHKHAGWPASEQKKKERVLQGDGGVL